MFYFVIAIKSIFERRRQYKSLFAVCAVGVCIMLCALMVTDGMVKSMNEKARQYYGGDLQFMGGHHLEKPLDEAVEEEKIIKECLGNRKDITIIKRFNHDADDDSYYFEGTSVRQRAIIGVDFESEKVLFDKFTFVEGSYHPGEYEDTVLLSEPVAKKLGCHVGDSILYVCEDDNDYINTIEVVLTGIFQDASVFGMYTSYITYDTLMRALDREPEIDRISFYYENGSPSKREQLKLQESLEAKFNMYPFGIDKKAFYKDFKYERDKSINKWCLIPLESNVSDLKLLVQALKLIVAAIVIMLVIIISVGISSTYRVIVIKRSLESGTLRAIGMKSSGIMKLFISEALLLLLSGCLTGFIFSAIAVKIASIFDLSFISGFDLFLTGGHLIADFNPLKIAGYVAIIIVTTLVSVLFTLRKLVRISPVGAITATT